MFQPGNKLSLFAAGGLDALSASCPHPNTILGNGDARVLCFRLQDERGCGQLPDAKCSIAAWPPREKIPLVIGRPMSHRSL